VKTHAHAVYRKLDATSRSEAVERARRIGLVDL
jgi:ATP/maltotriose-dependent transcriptional regulator MalT